MSKPKVGPEAKIIQLFDLLPDESKRIVRDILNAKPAKPAAQQAKEPSTRKKGLPTPAKEADKKGPKCGVCYEIAAHPNHDTEHYLGAHPFDTPKSAQRAGRRSSQKGAETQSTVNVETSAEGVSAVQIAAAGAGD